MFNWIEIERKITGCDYTMILYINKKTNKEKWVLQ
jgi:hypothetical protein